MRIDDDLERRVRAYALGLDEDTELVSLDEIAARRAYGTRNRGRPMAIVVAAVTVAVVLVAAIAVARTRTDRHAPVAPPAAISVRLATDTRAEIHNASLTLSCAHRRRGAPPRPALRNTGRQ